MRKFRFLLDFPEKLVERVNGNVAEENLIRVVKAALKGREGELVKFCRVAKVAVRIDWLRCTLMVIPASFIERFNNTEGQQDFER